ncbi:hypothetical protein ONS95_002829 [Cadophora gregata]|uniref:uncharacterized protein n=1 Tax=Cadophora gregata TaxID=51156 RepID=UPI0026DA91D5|nr:uncharacterized protein ONS95_002829 [Cadophora gregata]KAK0110178.1 hypothetical protein ONS95_002829 [Cadophora gregata]KAK0110207.1 hypothetical protein ONS96_001830 [Cadophora gregata f. sp. sojae]
MFSRLLVGAALLLHVVALPSELMLSSGLDTRQVPATAQQIAVASYFDPNVVKKDWERLIAYPTDKISVLVANVATGPDTEVNRAWMDAIHNATASRKRVLGYVRTGFFSKGKGDLKFSTRLNSDELPDWIAQIERDIDAWYALYPEIGGIFLDEGWNFCGEGTDDLKNIYAEAYTTVTEYTKRKYSGSYIILNPGATMPQCLENSADTLLTFENDYSNYTQKFVDNDWIPKDNRKLWHIVFDVPQERIEEVVALSRARGAGMIQTTNDVLRNPYDNLPDDTYMQTLINSVTGSTPAIPGPAPFPDGPAAATPTGLKVDFSEYTFVNLSWTPAAGALSYNIYLNDAVVATLPGQLTRVTIPGLTPGTSGLAFQVAAIGGKGVESSKSNTVTAMTVSTPVSGQYVFDIAVTVTPSTTTFSATIAFPYGIIRLFIWNVEDSCPAGWPINFNQGHFVCNHFLVDDKRLYKYTGVIEPGKDAPYSWDQIDDAQFQQIGSRYTWKLPIGSSTVDTSKWVLQTDGHGSSVNVFHPCPTGGNGPDGNARYCG